MTLADTLQRGLARSRLLFPDAVVGGHYADKAGEWWAGVYQAGAKVDVIYLGAKPDGEPAAEAVPVEAAGEAQTTLFD